MLAALRLDRPVRLATLAAALLTPAIGRAQTACPGGTPGTLRLSAGATVTMPQGVNDVYLSDAAGKRVASVPMSIRASDVWTVTQADVNAIKPGIDAGSTTLVFSIANGSVQCTRRVSIDSAGDVDGGGGGPQGGGLGGGQGGGPARDTGPGAPLSERVFKGPEECRAAGAAWESELQSRRGHARGHFTEIVFLEGTAAGGGDICYYNRDYGVVGDPIYVAVFTENRVTWRGVRFEPCAVAPAAPNVLQSGDRFPSALQGGAWKLQQFLERRCYNTAVDVSVVGVQPAPGGGEQTVAQRFPLQQYDRYRGTVQLGVLITPQHDADFALRPDPSDASRHLIYDKGPSEKGPEYVASLVLYSFLKYLPSLRGIGGGNYGQPYQGRDVIHDQDFFDRLGAVLGVGITNPSKRFIAGGSFEVLYGVNVIGVWDFARIRRLEGVSTTEPFSGRADEIPTHSEWRSRFTGGLSIDLRYASMLFTGNR